MALSWMEFHVYTAAGAFLAVLDGARRKSYQETRNETGAGQFEIHADDTKATTTNLALGNIVKVLYRGTTVGAWVMEDFDEVLVDSGEGAAQFIRVSGRGLMSILDHALVYPSDLTDFDTGERTFEDKGKAYAFVTLFDEYTNRGGSGLTLDFTATHDSNNDAWNDLITISYRAGQTLLDVLTNLSAFGMDFSVSPAGVLSCVPSPAGTDRSATVVFREGHTVLNARSRIDGALLANAVLGVANGLFYESTDATSITSYGRREYHLPVHNTDDIGVISDANLKYLTIYKNPYTAYELAVTTDVYQPFVDYDVFDTVTVTLPGKLSSALIIAQITLAEDNNGVPQVTLGVNDVTLDYLQRMQRAFEATLLNSGPITSRLANVNGAGLRAVTRLWIGHEEGPRVGLLTYEGDAGDDSYTLEAVGPDNVPFFSAGALNTNDDADAWCNIGYAGYPRIHMETVAGYGRKLPVVDATLISGTVTAGSVVMDAADVTYTPTVLTDWDSDADPGNLDDSLNQLAERVDDLEAAPPTHAHDAADVTYTPAVLTDWDSDADPGNTAAAVDQLAERVDDLENAGAATHYRQFTYIVTAGDFSFVIDDDGVPVMALQALESV